MTVPRATFRGLSGTDVVRPFDGDPAWEWPPVFLLPRYRAELVRLRAEVRSRRWGVEQARRLPPMRRHAMGIDLRELWASLDEAERDAQGCMAAIRALENSTCPHWSGSDICTCPGITPAGIASDLGHNGNGTAVPSPPGPPGAPGRRPGPQGRPDTGGDDAGRAQAVRGRPEHRHDGRVHRLPRPALNHPGLAGAA